MKLTKNPLFYLSLVLAIVVGLQAWTLVQADFSPPTTAFPTSDVSAPLETSGTEQTKGAAIQFSEAGVTTVKISPLSGLCLKNTSDLMECKRYWSGTGVPGGFSTLRVANGNDWISLNTVNDSNYSEIRWGDDTSDRLRFFFDHYDGTAQDKEVVTILSNGNVGIGALSPGVKLDVAGEIRATSNASKISLLDSDGTVDDRRFQFLNDGGALNLGWTNDADNAWTPLSMTIKNDGNVGIGTTSPATKLDVNGTITATAFVGDGSGLTNLPGGGGGGGGEWDPVTGGILYDGGNVAIRGGSLVVQQEEETSAAYCSGTFTLPVDCSTLSIGGNPNNDGQCGYYPDICTELERPGHNTICVKIDNVPNDCSSLGSTECRYWEDYGCGWNDAVTEAVNKFKVSSAGDVTITGDLTVEGNLIGRIETYLTGIWCRDIRVLTTDTTCPTRVDDYNSEYYYNCSGGSRSSSVYCANTLVGYLFPPN